MRSRRAYLRLGALCSVVGVAGCPGESPDPDDDPVTDDWPMYRRDAANTGYTPATGPAGDVDVLWSVDRDEGGQGISWPPSIHDGTVYVGDKRISAFDASTGDERWTVPSEDEDERYFATPLTVIDETIYLGSHRRFITALSATDGEEYWRHDIGSEVYAGPTVTDDTIYVGTDSGFVYALKNDEELWSVEVITAPEGSVTGAPAVVDGTVYITTANLYRGDYEPGTYALDAETGEELWFAPFDSASGTFASPVVSDTTVYLVDLEGNVLALDAETGADRWRIEGDRTVEYSVAVSDGSVFVPSDPFTAYDAETGAELWTTEDTGRAIAPVVASDTLYVTDYDDTVYALASDSGEIRWRYELVDAPAGTGDWYSSPPVVSAHVVYVKGPFGNLYALGVA